MMTMPFVELTRMPSLPFWLPETMFRSTTFPAPLVSSPMPKRSATTPPPLAVELLVIVLLTMVLPPPDCQKWMPAPRFWVTRLPRIVVFALWSTEIPSAPLTFASWSLKRNSLFSISQPLAVVWSEMPARLL